MLSERDKQYATKNQLLPTLLLIVIKQKPVFEESHLPTHPQPKTYLTYLEKNP